MMKSLYFAAAILLGTAASAAAADILVVRANGPSAAKYPPGKSIPDSGKITLLANDSLVLLDGRGTRTVRGPGTFLAGGPVHSANGDSSLSVITKGVSQRRARIGAVRSVSAAPRSPSIWHVDVAKSATVCLAEPSNVTLWRPDASQAVTLSVTGSDGATRKLDWAKGEATLALPADFKIDEGASYRLSWDGAAAPTSLKFRTLSEKPAGLEDMASSLIKNGCEAQLDLLIETVKLPEDQSAPLG
jgi:hypothetical protein